METYLQLDGDQAAMFALIAGAAVAMLAWGLTAASTLWFSPMRRRLAALRGDPAAAGDAPFGWRSAAAWWSRFEPRAEADRTRQRLRLAQAGYRARGLGGVVSLLKVLLAIGLPALAMMLLPALLDGRLRMPVIVLIAAGTGALGMLLPEAFLQRRIESRKDRLMEGFPDALDLLVACTEAGLSFNAALERVVEQMPASQPELAWELAQVNAEIRAGIDRTSALKRLAERTGLDEIRGLVSLITHSTRLGTGIAGTLRIYAEEFRDRRMQRAEEIAATVSTRLIFPLVLCLFPSFFVIAIGPAVIGVVRALAGTPLAE